MRSAFAVIGIILINMFSVPQLQAQETTFTIGIPGNITATNSVTGNITGQTISTAQIDSVLRTVAPGAFGQNFTRDKANKVFADFNNFRTNLSASLAQTIATQPNIQRVNLVTINTPSLNLRLSQKTNSVSGELGTAMASVSLVSNVNGILGALFCPSANVTFNIDNIRVSGDYNYISGDVSNVAATYDVTNVKASCNGLLGFVGNTFGNPSATARSMINAAIQSQAASQLAFLNMKQLFSLSDFANSLNYFRNETPLTSAANQAISLFKEMVNDAAVNTLGIIIDFNVELSTNTGILNNQIKLIASSAPVDVEIPQFKTGEPIEGNLNSLINQDVDLYYSVSGGNWIYGGSTVAGNSQLPILPNGARLIAIGRNPYITGLESLPGTVGIFRILPCKGRCIVS
jgi:hypothetical protein